MKSHPLVGTWVLERWSARLPSGASASPMGERPFGILVYDAEGTMSAQFMNTARTRAGMALEEISTARRRWLDFEAGEKPAAFKEMLFSSALAFNGYAGRYVVEGDRVHHDVEVALYPDWIGKRLSRIYRVEEPTLVLTTINLRQEDRLEWRRRSPAR